MKTHPLLFAHKTPVYTRLSPWTLTPLATIVIVIRVQSSVTGRICCSHSLVLFTLDKSIVLPHLVMVFVMDTKSLHKEGEEKRKKVHYVSLAFLPSQSTLTARYTFQWKGLLKSACHLTSTVNPLPIIVSWKDWKRKWITFSYSMCSFIVSLTFTHTNGSSPPLLSLSLVAAIHWSSDCRPLSPQRTSGSGDQQRNRFRGDQHKKEILTKPEKRPASHEYQQSLCIMLPSSTKASQCFPLQPSHSLPSNRNRM